MTLAWVAGVVGAAPMPGDTDAIVGDVVTDSRTLQPGDLFVALRGPRFDGHAFVADVLARGAVGAVVEYGFAGSEEQDPAHERRVADDGRAGPVLRSRRLVEVPDTLEALHRLAHAVRSAVESRVIAITGSAG
jgi:UDP-N-acetylmuramoyl-tripeptide--D-alanyl-D-alanine ligase